MKKWKKLLKDGGYKVTPQRLAVIRKLQQLDHPTAGEITEGLEQDYPMISPSTVYHTLRLMVDLGAVRPLREFKETRYDINVEFHPHLVCEDCGNVADIDAESLRDNILSFARNTNRGVNRIELVFYGQCRTCRKE